MSPGIPRDFRRVPRCPERFGVHNVHSPHRPDPPQILAEARRLREAYRDAREANEDSPDTERAYKELDAFYLKHGLGDGGFMPTDANGDP